MRPEILDDPVETPAHPLIAIGGSAGAIEPLLTILRELDEGFAGSVFVVVHMPPSRPSSLPRVLARAARLNVVPAMDGAQVEPGHVYVAPPDRHLTVQDGCCRVIAGPRENRSRPAIDPLFRSIAVFGRRATGVVLSGALNDGAAGLAAIDQADGRSIVQNPDEALYQNMPDAALREVPHALVMRAQAIGRLLAKGRPPSELAPVAPSGRKVSAGAMDQIRRELRAIEMQQDLEAPERPPGSSSVFSCPDCGGVLWELTDGNHLRFRCRVGHAITADILLGTQSQVVEDGLWAALRSLEEQAELAQRLAERSRGREEQDAARAFEEQRIDALNQAKAVRALLEHATAGSTIEPESA